MKTLNQAITDEYALYWGDSCEVVKGLPENSVHYSIFSPPFSSLYTYSASDRDMGNCTDDDTFRKHFDFLIGDLLRVTKPGRLLSFHCMNLPTSKARDGVIGLRDFRGELIESFCGGESRKLHDVIQMLQSRAVDVLAPMQVPGNTIDEKEKKDRLTRYENLTSSITVLSRELEAHTISHGGWIYHSEVCIWKDPVTAMQRTKALGLLHKQICKDSCMSRQGIPDYLVTMRKPGVNPEPVSGQFEKYIGAEGTEPGNCTRADEAFQPMGDRTAKTRFSIDVWQRYASPVWMDIDATNTLQSFAEEKDERHICPLQLQVIERGMDLWSNPSDTILSPFAGIGSEGYVSIKAGRKFIGCELKEAYWAQAVKNLNRAVSEMNEKVLFGGLK